MTIRRAFWRLAYPFAVAGHRLGLWSYEWVNVGHGAWHADMHNPLWQHERYGMPLTSLPESVVLSGCGYRTAVAEGTVTFVEDFTKARITFDRDPYRETPLGIWYVGLSKEVPAAHFRDAYAWVSAVFGGSHEWKREPVTENSKQDRNDG